MTWADAQNALLHQISSLSSGGNLEYLKPFPIQLHQDDYAMDLHIVKVPAASHHFLSRFTSLDFYLLCRVVDSTATISPDSNNYNASIPFIQSANAKYCHSFWHSSFSTVDYTTMIDMFGTSFTFAPINAENARFLASLLASSPLDIQSPIFFYSTENDSNFFIMCYKHADSLELAEISFTTSNSPSSSSFSAAAAFNTSFQAEYKILDSSALQNSCKISATFSWKTLLDSLDRSSTLPDTFKPSSASDVLFRILCYPCHQDMDSFDDSVKNMLFQLTSLSNFNKLRQGQINHENWKSQHSTISTSQRVTQFLDKIEREGSTMIQNKPMMTKDAAAALNRTSLDFIDRLWVLLLESINTADLVETLTAVIDDLETGRLLPMLHKNNDSTFARIIRECLKMRKVTTDIDIKNKKLDISRQFDELISINGSSGSSLFDTIVEMGIGKLTRDFFNFFVGQNLLSTDQYSKYIQTSSKSELIFRLFILLRIVEVYSIAKHNIVALLEENLRIFIQSVFEFWESKLAEITVETVYQPILYQLLIPKYSQSALNLVETIAKKLEPSSVSKSFNVDSESFVHFQSNNSFDLFANAGFPADKTETVAKQHVYGQLKRF